MKRGSNFTSRLKNNLEKKLEKAGIEFFKKDEINICTKREIVFKKPDGAKDYPKIKFEHKINGKLVICSTGYAVHKITSEKEFDECEKKLFEGFIDFIKQSNAKMISPLEVIEVDGGITVKINCYCPAE